MIYLLKGSFQHITVPVVILFGLGGFLFGFFFGLQNLLKERMKFHKLKKEVDVNKLHVASLKEKAADLLKRNIELGGKGANE